MMIYSIFYGINVLLKDGKKILLEKKDRKRINCNNTYKLRGKGHFTLLLKGKRIIGCYRADYSGTGCIMRKTGFKSDSKCCHSEIKCLKANLHRKDLNKLKIVNLKIKYENSRFIFSLSRPCTECRDTLIIYGIRGVYYFTDEKTIVYEKLSSMKTVLSSWDEGKTIMKFNR